MKVTETSLKGAFIIDPKVFGDHRGIFFEGFNKENFEKEINQSFDVKQVNHSTSTKGVLRGLHFQTKPKAQSKLVSVVEGEVLDVAVDLRKNSNTYGQYISEKLSGDNQKQLFIPKGMAHGFIVLSEYAKIMYLVDENYSPEHDSGILYNDSQLDIDWLLKDEELVLSEKDKKLPTLAQSNLDF